MQNREVVSSTNYISIRDTLVAIDRQSGKWCTLDQSELSNVTLKPGVWDINTLPIDSMYKEQLVKTVAPALASEKGVNHSDNRIFEYLLVKCTSECNYSCTYCYDHDELEKGEKLDASQVCRWVREGIEHCNGCFTLLFHGGEPLLRKRFIMEVTEFAKNYAISKGVKLFLKLQTHGGMFTDEIIGFLTANDFFVGISIDGPAEINDRYRILTNGKGTYHKFEAAYERYTNFMQSRCGIITTPTDASAPHLLQIARHFRDMGFKAWRTTNYLAIGRVQDDWRYEAQEEVYAKGILDLADAVENDLVVENGKYKGDEGFWIEQSRK
ncbi:MAG: radical SAM protein [Candidatus Thiodiazotropha sp. (ex Rostrolucina anterorostrata)]|nr:radical SAM protein [Candidatus Thiodiazotropha sp. (ex Rostrolucina anterorostrata)]